jgi:hypothetical protein
VGNISFEAEGFFRSSAVCKDNPHGIEGMNTVHVRAGSVEPRPNSVCGIIFGTEQYDATQLARRTIGKCGASRQSRCAINGEQ